MSPLRISLSLSPKAEPSPIFTPIPCFRFRRLPNSIPNPTRTVTLRVTYQLWLPPAAVKPFPLPKGGRFSFTSAPLSYSGERKRRVQPGAARRIFRANAVLTLAGKRLLSYRRARYRLSRMDPAFGGASVDPQESVAMRPHLFFFTSLVLYLIASLLRLLLDSRYVLSESGSHPHIHPSPSHQVA